MKIAAITTALMSSLLVACSDGVTIGNQNPAVVNDGTNTTSPFDVTTPVDNPDESPVSEEEPGDEVVSGPMPGSDPVTTPDNTSGTPNTALLGLVGVTDVTGSNITTAFGTFFELREVSQAQLAQLLIDPDEDVCEVFFESSEDERDVFEESINISAGEVLTLTSPAGSFAELTRDDSLLYSADGGFIASGLPASLTVDIPGDVFPAFSNVSVPVVQPFTLTAPAAGQLITTGTNFIWATGNNPNAYIQISASGQAADVVCTVRDDGSFTFPTDVQNELGSGFTSQFFTVSREAQNTVQSGNAVLVTSASSS